MSQTAFIHPRPCRRGIYRAPLAHGNRPGPWPPNALLATPLAAKLLAVSTRQMGRWRKLQIGPVHEPRGKWRGNVVRYELAQLLAFRNRVLKSGPGTYQGVWSEWMEQNRPLVGILIRDPWPPPKLTRAWRRGGMSRYAPKISNTVGLGLKATRDLHEAAMQFAPAGENRR